MTRGRIDLVREFFLRLLLCGDDIRSVNGLLVLTALTLVSLVSSKLLVVHLYDIRC